MMTKRENEKGRHGRDAMATPISLAPLTPEQALVGLLATPPEPAPAKKKARTESRSRRKKSPEKK
jgi:hypothetical protein